MKTLKILLFAGLLFYTGCKEESLLAPSTNLPGYQQDIPWPSLADSPWPKEQSDAQLTGRCKYLGPAMGVVNWRIKIPTELINNNSYLSPVIGNDSSIYFIAFNDRDSPGCFLYSLSTKGQVRWKFSIASGKITSPPIVLNDGSILFADWNNNIITVDSSGKLIRKITLPASVYGKMNVSKSGLIYALTETNVLYAINKDGNISWQKQLAYPSGSRWSCIILTPDESTIYVKSQFIYALNKNGEILWSFNPGEDMNPNGALVDNAGNIYFSSYSANDTTKNGLFCLTPNGEIRYRYKKIAFTDIPPVIDYQGNIFYAIENKLISLNYYGKLNWEREYAHNFSISSNMIVDKACNLYIQSWDKYLMCINNGNVQWETQLDGNCFQGMAISNDRKIFLGTVGGTDRYFYSIK